MNDADDASLFLGLDVGTYETKAVLCDGRGQIVARARRPHGLSIPRPGYAEHDAEIIWWEDLRECTAELLKAIPHAAERIRAIGCSAIGPCVVPLDAELRPLRPAILYGVDTRASPQIAELRERLGASEIFRRSGNELTSQSAGPKIKWIADNEPEIFARARWFVSSQSYLVARLTGEVTLDHATAGYFHPLYDLEENTWDVSGCEDFISQEKLPRLGWSSEIAGTVTQEAAKLTGLLPGTPVIFGTTDAPAEAVGSGVLSTGDLMIMYGSSTYLIEVLDGVARDRILWSAPYVFEGSSILAAGTSTAGTLTHWLAELFGLSGNGRPAQEVFVELLAEAQLAPPGARGLLALPSFSGERTPWHDPNARGVLLGLSLDHGRAEIARAIMEGVGHSVAKALESFTLAGYPPARVVAVGGGTKNPIFLETVSTVSGCEQHVVDSDGAALGDAALAALGVGHVAHAADIAAWVRCDRVISPDTESNPGLLLDHADYVELYTSTADLTHRRTQRSAE